MRPVVAGLCLACGSGGSGPTESQGPDASLVQNLPYEPCDPAEDLGGVEVLLEPTFSSVDGSVYAAVSPLGAPEPVASDERCRVLVPPRPECDPGCAAATETCGSENACVPLPERQDLGSLRITGLAIPMEIEPNQVTKRYVNPARPALPHPGFEPGAALGMTTTGGVYPALDLLGWGVSPIELTETVRVNPDEPTVVSWRAPERAGPARVRVRLEINVHGASKARIECDFPDEGSGTISAELVNRQIEEGISGFPSVTVERRTVTSQSVGPGCVDFSVSARLSEPAEVAGIRSCNDDVDCELEGGSCLPILRYCQ